MPFTYARPPLRSYGEESKSSRGTEWPAYSYVAPMSWKVVAAVERARLHANYSDYATLDPAQQHVLRQVTGHVVAGHRMPAWYYLTLHPDAKLSAEDRAVIAGWAHTSTIDGRPLPAPTDSTPHRS